MAKYGYIRNAPGGPTVKKQMQLMAQYGVGKDHIYIDEGHGGRKQYFELLQKICRGDLLVIKSLSSLGDGYECIARDWLRITEAIGADICIADMPAIDTRVSSDRKLIVSAVGQLLNYYADRQRARSASQAKGIESARQRGVKFGRPPKKYDDKFIEVAEKYRQRKLSLSEALALTGMKQSSVYYHMRKFDNRGI